MPSYRRSNRSNAVCVASKDAMAASGEGALAVPSVESPASKRVFPFFQTPSGNLKVGPNQVVFESKKVSVLVADPKHTKVNVRAEIDNRTFITGSHGESLPIIFGSDELPSKHIEGEIEDIFTARDAASFRNSVDSCIENCPPSQVLKQYSLERLSSTNLPAVDWSKTPLPPKTELFTRLLYRITNYVNPDVEILISNEVFSCHLLVLQCYSNYFDQTKQASKLRLPEESVTPRAFATIYNWMIYPGSDSFHLLSRENILEVFIASQNLQIKELEEQCWTFINCDNIFSEETAFLLYSKAKEMNNSIITQLMMPRIMRFFLKLVGTTNFVELDLEDVCSLLRSNFIAVHNEIEVFMSAVRWLLHDWEHRKMHLKEVMGCVRFGWIAPWQLVDIRRNPENPEFIKVTSHSVVQQLIEDGLSYAIIKYWYGNQTQDYYHWVDILGLQEPSQRNWIDKEKNYVTYQEFLIALEMYQQLGFLDKIQLRSQQLNSKGETFPPPPTVAEFMAQRGKFLEEMKGIHDFREENEEIEVDTEGTLPLTLEESQPKPKEKLRLAFWNTKLLEFYLPGGFESTVKCSEKKNFGTENEKNFDFENLSKSKDVGAIVKEMLDLDKPPLNAATQSVLGSQNMQHSQYKSHPVEDRSLEENPEEVHPTSLQKDNLGFKNKEFTEVKGNKSLDEISITRSLSVKHQQKISSLFASVSKDSLDPLKYINQMNSSHRNYLKEGSLFFPDEEAVLVFGGIDPHRPYGAGRNTGRDIYRYQPHVNAWELIGELPAPRHHHSVAFLRGRVFLTGGADPRKDDAHGKSVVVGTMWSYDPVTRKWLTEATMLTPRKHFGLVVSNGKLYVIGGQDKNGCILSSVECFNPASAHWKEVAPLAIGRMGVAATKYRDLIWVAGGMTSSKSTSLSDLVECFDIRRNVWLPNGRLRCAQCFSQLFAVNDVLYLIGGAGRTDEGVDSTASINAVDVWDGNSMKWRLKDKMAIPRHGHSLAYLGTQVFIVGGVTTMYMRALSNVECFCSVRSTWIHGVANLPTPLSGHGSVTLPPGALLQ